MQQYLTLEEAAKYLQMSPDDLREMAKKKTVRAFQDRGTWRFRSQDIEELARARGLASDVDLQLGEAAKPPSGASPRPSKKPTDSDLLPADFTLDESEEVPLGREKPGGSGRSGRSPKPGSDSDVRLVMDGDQDIRADAGKSGSSKKTKGGDSASRSVPSPAEASDSDVRLEPSSKDSGASKRGSSKSPSDSDIRLHEATGGKKKPSEIGQVTEEIDLDVETSKLKDQPKKKPGKPTQMASKTQLPGPSPFELSESDEDVSPPKKGGKPAAKKNEVESSSDFELIPFDSSKSPVELGSGEIPLLEGDEEVSLGSEVSGPNAGSSGINLKDPADSGISLEDGGSDEIEFELSLEEGTPSKPTAKSASRKPSPPLGKSQKPKPKKGKEKPPAEDDSSSEFELSLEEDSSPMDNSSSEFELSLEDESPTEDSSSEFELSLEDSSHDQPNDDSPSDSEFELTLDDEGGLAVDEEAGDIFEETNFDVPALEDESGSEAVAIDESDTDLEGSDFEISLDEDSSADEDSDSQVVALEDEEADEGAATVARPRKTASKSGARARPAVIDDSGEIDVDLDDAPKPRRAKATAADDDLDDDEDGVAAGAVAAEQEWGPVWVAMMFPTVLVMFLVGIMGFELLRGMFGYHRATAVGKPVIDFIARNVDDGLPK